METAKGLGLVDETLFDLEVLLEHFLVNEQLLTRHLLALCGR